jgi:hypothetical protein
MHLPSKQTSEGITLPPSRETQQQAQITSECLKPKPHIDLQQNARFSIKKCYRKIWLK